jgi:transcriptional regulator with XRE-family HTH domain
MGVTQHALARRARISAGYLSSIENDRVAPPSSVICLRLTAALQLLEEERIHLCRAALAQRRASRVRLPPGLPAHVSTLIQELLNASGRLSQHQAQQITRILASGGRA